MADLREGSLSKKQVDERFKKSFLLLTLPPESAFFQLWPTIVLFDALLSYLLYNFIKAYICIYTVLRVPRQWRPVSSKRENCRMRRIRNWKRRKKNSLRFKRKQLQNVHQRRQKKDDWECESMDDWIVPDGHIIGEMFEEVCTLCPDFYEFGIRTDFVTKQCDTVLEGETFFLGGSQESYKDLLLPDRQCFLYFTDALEDLPIIFDTGASISITPDIRDFEEYRSVQHRGLTNITGESPVLGEGVINWTLYDDDGTSNEIRMRAYYVPGAKVQLLSVQSYLGRYKGTFHMEGETAQFTFQNGKTLTFKTYNTSKGGSLLPLAYLTRAKDYRAKSGSEKTFNVLSRANVNLSAGQKELLGWHFKLRHFNVAWIQRLTRPTRDGRPPLIPFRLEGVPTCDVPLCAACCFSKATTLSVETSTITQDRAKRDSLKRNNICPGSRVSTDQFVSSARGRLPTTAGKEREKESYSGGTVYVDEASGLIKIVNKVSLKASETILGKHTFERFARTCGVDILAYRGDNGIFKSAEYKADLAKQKQAILYSGVGAHHQNGVAERSIRTVSESARSMLIHAALHWPEQVETKLWPFAMEYATFLYNHLPKDNNHHAPIEIFSSSQLDKSWIKKARVFGCPAYVLNPAIQDGKKLPRWKPKSKKGNSLVDLQTMQATLV